MWPFGGHKHTWSAWGKVFMDQWMYHIEYFQWRTCSTCGEAQKREVH